VDRHIEAAEHLLTERGRQVGRARIAVGRSGIAIGFPDDPLIHISWWAPSALVLLGGLWMAYRRAARAQR
jgi:hypothetical protein